MRENAVCFQITLSSLDIVDKMLLRMCQITRYVVQVCYVCVVDAGENIAGVNNRPQSQTEEHAALNSDGKDFNFCHVVRTRNLSSHNIHLLGRVAHI